MTKDVKGRRVLVVGMGKSGAAAIELLLRAGAEVRAVDQKPMDPVQGVAVRPQTEAEFRDVDLIVLSPGVPIDTPEVIAARHRGIHIVGEVELASWFLRGPVIGITGSNGKTTTTALIGHVLRESRIPVQVGGNIGTPPTSMVVASRDDQWNVFELSSFQLETVESFRARIAVATNVTDNHLDRHHTFENYAAAKARLFETQHPGDYAVLNADNPITVSYAGKTAGQVRWFSSSREVAPGVFLRDGVVFLDGRPWMQAAEIPIPGVHNIENTMAAGLAALLAGAPPDRIAGAVRTFPGVEHRIEFVRELRGVRYYNDSKATSVDATLKAIAAFPGGLWVILGGKDKNSDYTVLREPLRMKARRVLLIGAAALKIEQQLAKAVPMTQCETIDRAVSLAAGEAGQGETVLLAPACASFDQFRSFEHRGEVFRELVKAL
ncbi:MAG TPA: UDP-N-acetylmuramoyl-L-alanine--D-glutamate ligase [Bryobacteraceae bacterium]|nr:UDP-N-acetylmuramoyl-L-alanine--D-glutamate ligase [Bryobacteraceae bacterium]